MKYHVTVCCLVLGIACSVSLSQAETCDFLSSPTSTCQCNAAQRPSPIKEFSIASPLVMTMESAGYFGIGLATQEMFRKQVWFGSLHGGWLIDRRVFVGLGAYGMLEPTVSKELWGQEIKFNMIYGGAEGGYLFPMGSGLTLRCQLLLGITSIFYYVLVEGNQYQMNANDTIVIEPGVYLDIPIWGKLELSIGTHYHYTLGAEGMEGMKNEELSAIAGEVVMRVRGF